jgi:hypothetical protein
MDGPSGLRRRELPRGPCDRVRVRGLARLRRGRRARVRRRRLRFHHGDARSSRLPAQAVGVRLPPGDGLRLQRRRPRPVNGRGDRRACRLDGGRRSGDNFRLQDFRLRDFGEGALLRRGARRRGRRPLAAGVCGRFRPRDARPGRLPHLHLPSRSVSRAGRSRRRLPSSVHRFIPDTGGFGESFARVALPVTKGLRSDRGKGGRSTWSFQNSHTIQRPQ